MTKKQKNDSKRPRKESVRSRQIKKNISESSAFFARQKKDEINQSLDASGQSSTKKSVRPGRTGRKDFEEALGYYSPKSNWSKEFLKNTYRHHMDALFAQEHPPIELALATEKFLVKRSESYNRLSPTSTRADQESARITRFLDHTYYYDSLKMDWPVSNSKQYVQLAEGYLQLLSQNPEKKYFLFAASCAYETAADASSGLDAKEYALNVVKLNNQYVQALFELSTTLQTPNLQKELLDAAEVVNYWACQAAISLFSPALWKKINAMSNIQMAGELAEISSLMRGIEPSSDSFELYLPTWGEEADKLLDWSLNMMEKTDFKDFTNLNTPMSSRELDLRIRGLAISLLKTNGHPELADQLSYQLQHYFNEGSNTN